MQDTEFTVEDGRLYMLQTRSAKRHARAAVRFAVDAVDEGLLDARAGDRARSTPTRSTRCCIRPSTPAPRTTVVAARRRRLARRRQGRDRLHRRTAVEAAADGRDVILVRPFTEAEDVAGFHAAKGILTSEGGKASHAALVARGMGRPAVTGAADVDIDLHAGTVRIGERVLHEGDPIAIDGTAGAVTLDDVPLVTPSVDERFERVLGWCDELRTLGVRANADTPEDARRARELGAEGIGLCRTEHMFMAADRQPKMRAMVLADDEAGRRAALDELLPLQQRDFEGLFAAMAGRRSRSGCSTRRCTSSCPTASSWPRRSCGARFEDAPGPAGARARARARARDRGGQPDARHARRAARAAASGDLRDAGPRDLPRGAGGRDAAAARRSSRS